MTVTSATHWRAPDETEEEPLPISSGEAEAIWAAHAPVILAEVATRYQRLITHTELAAQLQEETGVHTRSNPQTWMGRVLAIAAAHDLEAGSPPFTSLVVHKVHGTVGESYDEVLRITGQDPITDPVKRERHAAEARMECYRFAGADLPDDGGRAALSPRYDMVLTRDRRKARQEAVPNVCPTCFMAIPPTGECDNCG